MRKPITVLWFGGGQDSTALLYLSHFNDDFKREYLGLSNLVVIMSDTGNEFPETYKSVSEIEVFCKKNGIEFHFIRAEMGYHSEAWKSLQVQFERNDNIMSVALPKSCTDKLKITVCYNFLEDLLKKKYGYVGTRKKAFYEYKKEFGRLNSIIGFAKGEESRQVIEDLQISLFVEKDNDPRPVYMRENVSHVYPLIEMGIDRKGCQEIIANYGFKVPIPSNCMMCPFQSQQEIVYLYRFHRQMWDYWVEREQAKLDKNAEKPRNLGVKGSKTLPKALEIALSNYGKWSDEQLIEYRNSHGHCVMSKY